MIRRFLVVLSAFMTALVVLSPQSAYAEPDVTTTLGRGSSADVAVELGAPDPAGALLKAQADCDGTRQAFLEVVGEQPLGGSKSNKYNNYSGADYCAFFVAWCAGEAGVPWDVIPRNSGYVTTFRDDVLDAGGEWLGWWEEPRAGDLIFYNNVNYSDLPGDQASGDDLNHVGVVVDVSGGRVYTKEGNTSHNGVKGCVGEHDYPVGYNGSSGWYVVGYVRPRFSERVTAPTWDYGGDAWLENGWYSIRPVRDSNKYLEVGGGGTENGTNIQIWEYPWMGERAHMRFHLSRLEDGSYAIDTFSGKEVDVYNASRDNGANVQQWEWNGSDAQRWYINDCGNGVYALQARCSGKYLDLANGDTGNGSNAHQWEYNGTDAQKWIITPCENYGWRKEMSDGWWYLRPAADPSYALDIYDASTSNGANLQIWEWNRTSAQQFRFVPNFDGSYRIEARCSAKVLDVENASRKRGANVQQAEWNANDCQRWYVQDAGDGKIVIQSKNSGLYLDIYEGSFRNYQNVQQWDKNDVDNARLFYLTPAVEGVSTSVEDGKYELTSMLDEHKLVSADSEGKYVRLSDVDGSSAQRFELTTVAGRTRLKNVGTNGYIDVHEASLMEETLNNLQVDTGALQQHWYVEDAGDGFISLRNDYTNMYLDVRGGKAESGTPLQMFRGNGTAAQKFRLRRLTLEDAEVDFVPDQAYTGSPLEPLLTVRFADRVLQEGRDYKVEWRDNVSPGEAMAVLIGTGDFSGACELRFRIKGLHPGWFNLPGGGKGYVKDGRLVVGWLDLGGSKYWFGADGAMATGWTDVTDSAGKTFHYYFNPSSGNLVRSTWFEIDGYKYYFRPSGNVARGWATIKDNGVDKKYYFDDDYHMVTGWRDIANSEGKDIRYYFRPSGSMATGWATIDGQKYWFRASGSMAKGFNTVDDGYKRYFDHNGHMLVGWQQIDGKTFYFRSPSGAMQTGKATIDGKTYEFTASGTLSSSTPLQPTGIRIEQVDSLDGDPGGTLRLRASVSPSVAADAEVTWTSDDESVATVDQTGLVTSVGKRMDNVWNEYNGTAYAGAAVTTIRARTSNGLVGSYLVYVVNQVCDDELMQGSTVGIDLYAPGTEVSLGSYSFRYHWKDSPKNSVATSANLYRFIFPLTSAKRGDGEADVVFSIALSSGRTIIRSNPYCIELVQ